MMMEFVISNLVRSGWAIHPLESSWICATFESSQRALFIGTYADLPAELESWYRNFQDYAKFDVIVLCPQGIDSEQLVQHRYPGYQLWYWDTLHGNLFPFPPANDQYVPQLIKQIASGNLVVGGNESQQDKVERPFLTYTLIGINSVVFILMVLAGFHLFPNPTEGSLDQKVLIKFGAKVNSLIREGEYWRLVTSMFIHIGIIHLIFNLYALKILGEMTEKVFGHRKFVAIYFSAGLGGSLASLIFSPVLSAGASGAIFGLLGALLYYSYKRPDLWKSGLGMNLIIVIAVNIGFGLIQPGIDNFAHLGGLTTGILLSFILNNHK